MKISNATAKSFHSYLDSELIVKPGFFSEQKETKHFIIQERDVSYRFFPHFHPFVGELVKRLLRKSTAGLQATDTEFYTRVQFAGAITARDPSGDVIQLANGETVNLVEGATARLADGDAVRFAGFKILRQSDDTPLKFDAKTVVTIPGNTAVRRADGNLVTLESDAAGVLLDGVPLPALFSEFFKSRYNPSSLVHEPYPVKDLDFSSSGAYAVYNWELFFHVPLTVAIHLSKNQRFADAQRWFHYLFDPTDDSDGPTPERFWKVRPFQTTNVRKIEEILVNIATNEDPDLRNETVRSIEAWKDAPFRPHLIARYRHQAYMYKTVMAYLDNLIAWGDSLFRQDTGEAVDEALMLYVLAAHILGPRPQPVPKKGSVRPQTYANLRADLSHFGVAMRDMETASPFDLLPFPMEEAADNERLGTLRSLGKALYFCVPRNDKLLSYWDTVADRLFKIRNSLNIQGTFRQLALFEPPIDPALLARATAAGLDVSSIVNGLNQPLPLVRFQLLVQKAAEICQEVKSLGSNLLSAMEKEDGEAMAILRSKHEQAVMTMVEQVRYGQVQEAIKSKEGLLKSLASAIHRRTYYERLLGKKPDEIVTLVMTALDAESLAKLNLTATEPEFAFREIPIELAQDLEESGGKIVNDHEAQEMVKLKEAREKHEASATHDKIGSALAMIPAFAGYVAPLGAGATVTLGGRDFATATQFTSTLHRTAADERTYEAGRSAKIGNYARREQEWAFQSNLAAAEINQIFKQIRAAEIRQAIAELELKNHQKQMEQAEEIERFLNEEGAEKTGKKTNQAFYAWMKREVKGLYAQIFQFAFDTARKAERALQHELGNRNLNFLQFGYLAGKEGLLAGEKLFFDIKHMEMAYHELNQREYELVKHVSLLQVDPLALIKLRATGSCSVRFPEEIFDMDGPGHYFRRIKTVAVSIPCVAGPYANVNCTLTLLKGSVRQSQLLRDGKYAREEEDDRFNDYFGSVQSIVTSSAQSDTGLFETNLRDERYLPFENSGTISQWQLELPANPSKDDPMQFDYDTISDVILHIRYTAREGGALLRRGAIENLKTALETAQAAGSVRLFSLRHEFPTEWAKFRSAPSGNIAELKL
ncbi:MAG TPA: hypothetical protein VIT23_15155, partial [Terrimicrobiaceae bacterium]